MNTIENDELGFDSALSPDLVETLLELDNKLVSGHVKLKQSEILDEHELAISS